jgi:DNA gyrase subunit A
VITGPLAPESPQVVLLTEDAVRCEPAASYRDRAATGAPSSKAIEAVLRRFVAAPDATVILVSNLGRLWKGSVARLAQGLTLNNGERLVYAGVADPLQRLVLATRSGNVKRVNVDDALNRAEATWGAIIGMEPNDQVVFAALGSDEAQVFLYSAGLTGEAKVLRFAAQTVNPQATPSARGMAGMKLPEGEALRGGLLFEPGSAAKALVLLTTQGLIRRVSLEEFPAQGRAGQGVQVLKLTDATGTQAGAALAGIGSIADVYSAKGKRLRLEYKDVPAGKRAHPGSSLRRMFPDLFGGEPLAAVVVLDAVS